MPMNDSFVAQVRTPGALSPEELERVEALYENLLMQSTGPAAMGRIPRTYAEALLAVAAERKQTAEVAADFHAFTHEVLPGVNGLEAYLDSPAVNRKAKDETILRVLEGRATDLFIDFLRVLNAKDRLSMVRFIGVAFRTLLEERTGRVRVLVESAVPLSDDQKNALTKTLADALGRTPILVVRERPELLGGLVVHVGDRVLDTSVRSKLETLRTNLLARGNHEIQSRRDRFSHN